MSWRSQGITGSNNIPLGSRRRGADDGDEGVVKREASVETPSYSNGDRDLKRGRSPEPRSDADGPRRRKKRNRWGDASENKAAGLMGLPTAIVANMTSEQLEAYTLHLRIEEISQKLRIDDVVPADGDRSPSPPPQYDNYGRRVNTREYRYRKRLEDERHKLIEKAMKTIPNYHPPQDYRRPTKTQEKVYVPVNDYPEINFSEIANPLTFLTIILPRVVQGLARGAVANALLPTKVGLLIGPRGNTLKKMETESQAKIAIRGKGSVKEGKGRSDAAHASNQEEDLHCLIMADTEEKVNKAKKLIHNVIETAASIPEGQNELKRNQLRELAALNGTLRDDENQACQNCGQIGHRNGGANWRNDGPPGRPAARIGGGDAVDREYEQFMQELGGGSGPPARIEAGPGSYNNGGGEPKPWQRGATGAAAPWRTRNNDQVAAIAAMTTTKAQTTTMAAATTTVALVLPLLHGSKPRSSLLPTPSYPGYPGYAAPGMGAPPAAPGMGAPGSGGLGAPPGLPGNLNALIQQYAGGAAPPPPPADGAPPPPPSDIPPPPPGA
ncbi:Branchpoint-bridging protein [Apiospora phragmitis]|uniref:Branchpoint-bridging protein n=1 Tax=Apiospora phragmitis TaxID=2905665 RepID=A0ABR1UHY4_9PEZI